MYNKEFFNKQLEQIRQQKPGKYEGPGIYCIKINQQIVYIGKSAHMDVRLANHICNIMKQSNEWQAHKYDILRQALSSNLTVGFDVLYKGNDIDYQEGVFIREYLPPLNFQIPQGQGKYTTNKKAKTITLQEIVGELQ